MKKLMTSAAVAALFAGAAYATPPAESTEIETSEAVVEVTEDVVDDASSEADADAESDVITTESDADAEVVDAIESVETNVEESTDTADE